MRRVVVSRLSDQWARQARFRTVRRSESCLPSRAIAWRRPGAALAESDDIHTIPEAPVERLEVRDLLGHRMARLDRDIDVAIRSHVTTSGTPEQVGRVNVTHPKEALRDATLQVGADLALLREHLQEERREHMLWIQAVVSGPWAPADEQQTLIVEGAQDVSSCRLRNSRAPRDVASADCHPIGQLNEGA